MLSPPTSPFQRSNHLRAPHRSPALVALQENGFELSVKTGSLGPSPRSIKGSPMSWGPASSNLDKPLPLEPHETNRRASSAYSGKTTVTNILDLYGNISPRSPPGQGDYAVSSPVDRYSQGVRQRPVTPKFHQQQAYRDTVAPILRQQHTYFDYEDGSPGPAISTDGAISPPESVQSTQITPEESPLLPSPVNQSPSIPQRHTKDAEHRKLLVSPLSAADAEENSLSPVSIDSTDHHRQLAYNSLSPPSTKTSPNIGSISFVPVQNLPDPMSARFSEVAYKDLVPRPLITGRNSSPVKSSVKQVSLPNLEENTPTSPRRQHRRLTSFSQRLALPPNPLSLLGITESHGGGKDESEGLPTEESEEIERVMAFATFKYPGMQSSNEDSVTPRRPGIKHGVANAMRRMSISRMSISGMSISGPGPAMLTSDTPRPSMKQEVARVMRKLSMSGPGPAVEMEQPMWTMTSGATAKSTNQYPMPNPGSAVGRMDSHHTPTMQRIKTDMHNDPMLGTGSSFTRPEAPPTPTTRYVNMESYEAYETLSTRPTSSGPGPAISRPESPELPRDQHTHAMSYRTLMSGPGPSLTETYIPRPAPPPPPKQENLAVPLTDYQKYGAVVFDPKAHKKKPSKQKKESVEEHYPVPYVMERRKSWVAGEQESNPHRGHRRLAHSWESARHKLLRSSSDKRREKLKEKITVIGPAVLTYGGT